ncbi:hypothetical protein [uncultured Tateyamaria sp.]|nr:hypothetical protein [uncultured Tateyamaria sp.]
MNDRSEMMKIRLTQGLVFWGFQDVMKDEEAENGVLAKPLVFARGEVP